MAKSDQIPKELLDKLSDSQITQLTKLMDGGVSFSEAAGNLGLDIESLTSGMDDKSANAVNALVNIGTGAATGGVAGAAIAAAGEGLKAVSEKDKEKDEEEGKQDKTLQRVGAGLGTAQVALGLSKGQSTGIPEFSDTGDTKRAADMLAEAYEQGIDPNILAEGKKDIEMRRRSMLYQSEGASTSGGERFNRDVVANLMSNKAGKELAISADREKYSKLGPAANALLQKDEMAFRRDMAKRQGAYRESEAAGQMIGAGIKNITGSLMLGEQFKAEEERKKYDNV